jgi:hypothetical protein
VIISVVCLLLCRLLDSFVVLARREVSKDAELLVLRHENAVLRRQVGRIRYEPADRLWFAALPRLAPRRRWGEVFPVTPATLLAIAAGFVHVDTVLLRRVGALIVIEHGTRRVRLAGITASPDGAWTTQAARNFLLDLGQRASAVKFVIRDGAGQFAGSFDAVFTAEGIRIVASNTARPHRSLGQLTPAQADTCPPEPVNLAEHRIHRKQVLSGLTHEYYVAA